MCINVSIEKPLAVTTTATRRPEETTQAVPSATAPEPVMADPQSMVMGNQQIDASFYYDQQMNQVVITLTRAETGEVVRQIPQEHMRSFMVGIVALAGKLFDEKG